MFNTEMICPKCKSVESKHPKYEEARDAEVQEIRKGNFNFEGIGLPKDLKPEVV